MSAKKRRHTDDTHLKTNVTTNLFQFKWTINDFRKIFSTKTKIKSKEFSLKKNLLFCCKISLKFHEDEDEVNSSSNAETYLSVFVNCNGDSESFVKIYMELFILDEEGKKCHKMTSNNDSPVNLQCFKFLKFITWEELIQSENKYLQNNALKLSLDITLTHYENNTDEIEEKENTQIIKKSDLSVMYKNPDFSDLTIIFDDVSVLVHKVIVAAKSEALYAKIKKLKNNELKLPLPLPIGQELISFIYNGTCPNLIEYFHELYQTAIRLKIHDLGHLIETTLSDSINVDNALSRLIWANEYKVDNLKVNAINFIKRNIQQIMKTKEFENFTEDHPNLTRELFFVIVENNTSDVIKI